MTITLLRPDGIPLTAKQHRQGLAPLNGGGFDRPLGGRSGFRVDTASDILTATSTTWTLKPCTAMIDPGATTHQGMYGWATDADITGPVTAADSTYVRKDIVYIQVNDSSAGDGSGAISAPVTYLAGTPGDANPPALPARSFLVGTITVPIAGGGSPTVVLNPTRFVAAGGLLPIGSKAERDTITPYLGMQVCRLDRECWTQTYTGVGTSGWEYTRPSRRVYAVVNGTNLVNETGSTSRVIYTMPSAGLTKPYPQTVNVVARIALVCLPIASGVLQEWLAVSANQSQVTDAQGRASVTFTVSSASVLETLQAETGPLTVASGADPFARMWIQRPTASAVDTTVSSDPSFTQMYIDLRPQDD